MIIMPFVVHYETNAWVARNVEKEDAALAAIERKAPSYPLPRVLSVVGSYQGSLTLMGAYNFDEMILLDDIFPTVVRRSGRFGCLELEARLVAEHRPLSTRQGKADTNRTATRVSEGGCLVRKSLNERPVLPGNRIELRMDRNTTLWKRGDQGNAFELFQYVNGKARRIDLHMNRMVNRPKSPFCFILDKGCWGYEPADPEKILDVPDLFRRAFPRTRSAPI
ncbi:UNVERIFIED_ORG: hypothetical protein LHK14_00915 [Roseateles sp. XES5]|nr:hypothetical protein [Roseateles sp. XES5]